MPCFWYVVPHVVLGGLPGFWYVEPHLVRGGVLVGRNKQQLELKIASIVLFVPVLPPLPMFRT